MLLFFLSCQLLVKIHHQLSNLEIPAVEIPIRPTHRPAQQRDQMDRFQSIARLAQRQLAVSCFLNLHRDNCCRATLM